jgi:hypothetical protein
MVLVKFSRIIVKILVLLQSNILLKDLFSYFLVPNVDFPF